MARMVNFSFFYPETLLACHEDLRKHFEPMITATQELPEVHVLTSLTLRLVRLAKASMVMCQEGLKEESQPQLRSASEAIVNLLYIMYVGPATGDKSSSDLARQFLAYGDVAYYKLVRRKTDRAREVFKKRQGMTDAQFDDFMRDKQRLSDEATKIYNCGSSRWHKMNLLDMAIKVRDNAPGFVDKNIADIAFSSFESANSATHADALSLRSQYNDLGNAPLELVFDADDTFAGVVSNQAIWAWKTIADYYNQADVVDKWINQYGQAIVKQRYEVSPLAP